MAFDVEKYAEQFCQNLHDGIEYYQTLFTETVESAKIFGDNALEALDELRTRLEEFMSENELAFAAA